MLYYTILYYAVLWYTMLGLSWQGGGPVAGHRKLPRFGEKGAWLEGESRAVRDCLWEVLGFESALPRSAAVFSNQDRQDLWTGGQVVMQVGSQGAGDVKTWLE